jgi:hypothetical protein
MEYVCDAPRNLTWFRLLTEGEAVAESLEMHHAVEKHYRRERERAIDAFHPTTSVFIEQDINKEAHIRRAMPLFLTLRDRCCHQRASKAAVVSLSARATPTRTRTMPTRSRPWLTILELRSTAAVVTLIVAEIPLVSCSRGAQRGTPDLKRPNRG